MNPPSDNSDLNAVYEQYKDVCPTNKLKSLKMLVKVTRGNDEKIMSKIEEWWGEGEGDKNLVPSDPHQQHEQHEEEEAPVVVAKPVLSTATSTRIIAPVKMQKPSPLPPLSEEQGRRPGSSTRHIGLSAMNEDPEAAKRRAIQDIMHDATIQQGEKSKRIHALQEIMHDKALSPAEKSKRIQAFMASPNGTTATRTTPSSSASKNETHTASTSSRPQPYVPQPLHTQPTHPPVSQEKEKEEDAEVVKRQAIKEILRDTSVPQAEKTKRIQAIQGIMHDEDISQAEKSNRIRGIIGSTDGPTPAEPPAAHPYIPQTKNGSPHAPPPVSQPPKEQSQVREDDHSGPRAVTPPVSRPYVPASHQPPNNRSPHVNSCQYHKCPLSLTSSLMYEGENRCEVAGCDVGLNGKCEGNGYMSCDKCDWDVCRVCFESGQQAQSNMAVTTESPEPEPEPEPSPLSSRKTTQTLPDGKIVITTDQRMSDGTTKRITETRTPNPDGSMSVSTSTEVYPRGPAASYSSAPSVPLNKTTVAKAIVTGLVSRPELNQKFVKVLRFDIVKKRYDVSTGDADSSLLALKPINLIFQVGTRVKISGLMSATASQFNGQTGIISRQFNEEGRYTVELEDPKKTTLGLKPDNCIAILKAPVEKFVD